MMVYSQGSAQVEQQLEAPLFLFPRASENTSDMQQQLCNRKQ